MRWTRALLGFLAIIVIPGESAACSCSWAGPFLRVAGNAPVIVRVRVLDYHGRNREVDLAMDVEVAEVLRGEVAAKQLRIWGDNGALCRPYVSGFPRGTEWILAIGRLQTDRRDPGAAPGDYFINGCGAYWVRVEGDNAAGHIHAGSPGEPTRRSASSAAN